MKDELKIFICTHKDFEPPVHNRAYQIVDNRDNKIKEHKGLGDNFYSEILTYYNVAEYEDLPPYVGFCHYRRYFAFMDNVPKISEVLKDADTLVIKPIQFNGNVRGQYSYYHNIEDLEIVENIIKEKFSDYYPTLERFLEGNTMFVYNMFIMKRETFKEYVKFIKGVLDEYIGVVGNDIERRVMNNQDKYFKHIPDMPQNDTFEYQGRIGSFLAERLTNVFFFKNFKNIVQVDVNITENKYNLKNNTI